MNDKNQHIVPYELLTRYLSNDISEEDRQAAEKWINSNSDNQKTFQALKSVWSSLDKVQDLTTIDLETEWERQKNVIRFKENPGKIKEEESTFWNVTKIAAVFIILFAAAFAIYYYGPYFRISRIVTDQDTKVLELSDGTVVTLNNNSSIKYPIKFKGDTREVTLNGEAFFEVSPDEDNPFIVNTKLTSIKVIGTSFNIRAYVKLPEIVVTVTEGQVAFYSNEEPEKQLFLEKNTQGRFNRQTGDLKSEPEVDINFLAWKTKAIIFENKPLNEAIHTLSDVYNTEIKLDDPDLNNCRITATFDQQSLDSVLKVIASTLDLQIREKDSAYIITGEACQ